METNKTHIPGLGSEPIQQLMQTLRQEQGSSIREALKPLIHQLRADLERQKTKGARELVKERALDQVASQLGINLTASDEGSGNYQVMGEILDELLDQEDKK
jgi:hypothetical protein